MVESFVRHWNSWGAEASFSDCGKYRWWLKRRCGTSTKTLLFIGLNPSMANNSQDDATLRRTISFSSSWGYGRLLVVNLFARVARKPSLLKRCRNPIGDLTDNILLETFKKWSVESDFDLWLGWGCGGTFLKRNTAVISMLRPSLHARDLYLRGSMGPLSLGATSEGHPRHPLYVSGGVSLKSVNCFLCKDTSC